MLRPNWELLQPGLLSAKSIIMIGFMRVQLIRFALFFLLSGLASWFLGQPSPPAVVMTASHDYGQALHFTLTGQSEVEIKQAVLFAAAPGLSFTYTTLLPVNSSTLNLTYTLRLQPGLRPAPFAPVRYWWELETTEGDHITLSSQILVYNDTRFPWQETTAEGITVYWTGENKETGATALRLAQQTRQSLSQIIPLTLPEPLSLYVYPTASDLRAALRLGDRDWADGHADPDLGVILVVAVNPRTASEDLAQTVPQEISRLFLYQATQANYIQVPRWLQEGLVGVVLEETGAERAVLAAAAADQSLLPFTTLCTWPTDPTQTPLALAQSRSLVQWLQQSFGTVALNRLIHAYARGENCAAGLRTATNLTLITLEQQWQQQLIGQPTVLTAIRQNGLWLLLVLAGFLLTALLLLSSRPRSRSETAGE